MCGYVWGFALCLLRWAYSTPACPISCTPSSCGNYNSYTCLCAPGITSRCVVSGGGVGPGTCEVCPSSTPTCPTSCTSSSCGNSDSYTCLCAPGITSRCVVSGGGVGPGTCEVCSPNPTTTPTPVPQPTRQPIFRPTRRPTLAPTFTPTIPGATPVPTHVPTAVDPSNKIPKPTKKGNMSTILIGVFCTIGALGKKNLVWVFVRHIFCW